MNRIAISLLAVLLTINVVAIEVGTDAKYAPDRRIDLKHIALDITPDFKKRTISGEVTLTFKPIAKALEELHVDAVDMRISSVASTEGEIAYTATDREIIVTFAKPIPADKEAKLTIKYFSEPTRGLFFRTPEMGYPEQDIHIWTQGETSDASAWVPCYDYPNLKCTSEITCRVPDGMVVLSNGRQVSSQKDPATGLNAIRWLQDKPHATYLLNLVAGKFTTIEETHRGIPLRFYTVPSDAPYAAGFFADTKPCMEFFEQEIGVLYPWAQYGQVVVRDFTAGGMENTTLTTLNDRDLHPPETENLVSGEGLLSHELAHQWFGDLVTCKDWSHTWLNEGFATYYQKLFSGHKHGPDELTWQNYESRKSILGQTDTKPIVLRKYGDPFEQFGFRSYTKGSWVLHMLRSQLGPDLFRRCIKTYLEKHAYQPVVTDDLRKTLEDVSGQSFDQFFDQWVYHGGYPDLEVSYSWEEKTKLARISVKQNQTVNDQVLLFRVPLLLRFKSKAGVVERRVEVSKKEDAFYVQLSQAPEIVRIDPDTEVLAKINFQPPTTMLYAQIADMGDMAGRALACEKLGEKAEAASIERLKTALANDSFYGVRIRAAEALRKIHNDEALEALIASMNQADARVRNAVVSEIANFYHPRTLETLVRVAETENNPVIKSTAIKGLGAHRQASVRDLLLRFLNTESHRYRLANAAIAAMRAQDNPAFVAPLREVLTKRETAFVSRDFGDALNTLAFLARGEANKDEMREFIAGYLIHKRDRVRLAAMRALGALEDPKAIVLLEKFATAAKQSPQQQEAEKAINALRSANKPAENLKDVQKDVQDLKKESLRQKKEIEDLKKRLEGARQ